MRVKVLVSVGLVLWAWSGVPVFAQQEQLKFMSKTDTGITFSGLDEAASSCGITKAGLDAAVRLPMSRHGFNPLFESVMHPTLFQVSVNVIRRTNIRDCIVTLSLRVNRILSIPENGHLVWGVTWRAGDLIGGNPMGMGRRVTNSLENLTNELIAAWMIDNPQ